MHIIVGSLRSCDHTFLNPNLALRRSAHYGVGKRGEVHLYVPEKDTAFHVGTVDRPSWSGLHPGVNPNAYTVGIEHEGYPDDLWPDAQIAASAALIAIVARRWSIPLDRQHVVTHHEIRRSKTCPGSTVDVGALLARAQAEAVYGTGRTVTTLRRVNVREGQPSTAAPILRTLSPGQVLEVRAIRRDGESVSGNPAWYEVGQGEFLWAGATDDPTPH